MKRYFYLIVILLITLFFTSCRPEQFGDTPLVFSTTEVTFDTVFTTVGSTIQSFTVHNPSHTSVKTDIRLGGGNQSYYSINVDGEPGIYFKDVIIPPKDSIYIFVKVTINPGNVNNPFLVTDSIEFITISGKQSVQLIAYGQDANFIVADSGPEHLRYKVVAGAHEEVIWTKEKPYVVYGWAVVDSLGTLKIEPGTKIYFHANSGLWVYRYGHLEAVGSVDEPILFRSDRLDEWFDSDFTQWSRIWIMEGNRDNLIDHAIVTNSYVGIQMEGFSEYTSNKTIISNTIIKNNQNSSVIARWANFDMVNCVVTQTGGCCLQLEVGKWRVVNSTLANYAAVGRDTTHPVVYVSNKSSFDLQSYHSEAYFENTIIDGNFRRELREYKSPEYQLNTLYKNCMIRIPNSLPSFVQVILNQNPQFKDRTELDFRLKSNSPAIDAGVPNGVLFDILGNPRVGNPDIGAYEFTE